MPGLLAPGSGNAGRRKPVSLPCWPVSSVPVAVRPWSVGGGDPGGGGTDSLEGDVASQERAAGNQIISLRYLVMPFWFTCAPLAPTTGHRPQRGHLDQHPPHAFGVHIPGPVPPEAGPGAALPPHKPRWLHRVVFLGVQVRLASPLRRSRSIRGRAPGVSCRWRKPLDHQVVQVLSDPVPVLKYRQAAKARNSPLRGRGHDFWP